ncbi:hypothetical protein D3C73_1028900 [compost metagenome]
MRGQEVEALENLDLFRCQRLQENTGRLAFVQKLDDLFHHRQLGDRFLVLAGGSLAGLFDAALQAFEVGEHQLGLDRVGVANRVDLALDMGDVVIFEAAQHVDDGVDFADIGKELVAQAFALRCTAHEAGDVDEGDAGRDDFLRTGDRRKLLHARIRNSNFTGVRLDSAERIVRSLRGSRLCQCVEKGGLADIGQSDDTAFKAHRG